MIVKSEGKALTMEILQQAFDMVKINSGRVITANTPTIPYGYMSMWRKVMLEAELKQTELGKLLYE